MTTSIKFKVTLRGERELPETDLQRVREIIDDLQAIADKAAALGEAKFTWRFVERRSRVTTSPPGTLPLTDQEHGQPETPAAEPASAANESAAPNEPAGGDLLAIPPSLKRRTTLYS